MVSIAKRPGWIALVSVLVFNLLLLSLQTNQHGSPGFMRKLLLDILVPGEKLVDSGVRGLWGIWDGYFALIGVQGENEKLRGQNDQLRMQIQQQDESVREAARLQSFPDGFVFCGTMNPAFRQIGNAVPPLLAKAVATHMMKTLKQLERETADEPCRAAAAVS